MSVEITVMVGFAGERPTYVQRRVVLDAELGPDVDMEAEAALMFERIRQDMAYTPKKSA